MTPLLVNVLILPSNVITSAIKERCLKSTLIPYGLKTLTISLIMPLLAASTFIE